MAGVIRVCPRCKPPTVRRLDGSRIVGFLPRADYVGYRVVPKFLGATRPPTACPNCGASLVERKGA